MTYQSALGDRRKFIMNQGGRLRARLRAELATERGRRPTHAEPESSHRNELLRLSRDVASQEREAQHERRVRDPRAVVRKQPDDLELVRYQQQRERARQVRQDRDGHDDRPLVLADPVVEEHAEQDDQRGEGAVRDLQQRRPDGREAESFNNQRSKGRYACRGYVSRDGEEEEGVGLPVAGSLPDLPPLKFLLLDSGSV
jgi:hypothetical protein